MTDKVSKVSVGYRFAGRKANKRCSNCDMFRPGEGIAARCTHVVGDIEANAVCDDWEGK